MNRLYLLLKIVLDKGYSLEEGIIKGTGKGKSDLLIKLLIKKFKVLPKEYREKIEELSSEAIEVIGTEIFDMESIEDLKKYF